MAAGDLKSRLEFGADFIWDKVVLIRSDNQSAK